MDFLKITQTQANQLANSLVEDFSPGYDSINDKYYIYSPPYTTAEQFNVADLLPIVYEGLTPINPNKPMFPKKG